MQITLASLPQDVTIVVLRPSSTIVLDQHLTRDEAALAIQGVMPAAHPDLVDHWLDRAYSREFALQPTLRADAAGV